MWVWIPFRRGVLDTTLCDKVCQWLAAGRWFSTGTPVSSTNEIDHHDITEILLKVALNTITIITVRMLNFDSYLKNDTGLIYQRWNLTAGSISKHWNMTKSWWILIWKSFGQCSNIRNCICRNMDPGHGSEISYKDARSITDKKITLLKVNDRLNASVYVPFVVITIPSFPYSWITTEYFTRVSTTGNTIGAGTAYPSGAHKFTRRFQCDSCCSIFSFLCNVL